MTMMNATGEIVAAVDSKRETVASFKILSKETLQSIGIENQ